MTKILKKIGLIVCVFCTLIAVPVCAQTLFSKSFPATVQVVEGIKDVDFFTNVAMTQPLTSFDFGNLSPGGVLDYEVWAKGVGSQSVKIGVRTIDDISMFGKITCFPAENWVPPTGFAQIKVRLTVNNDATPGDVQNFTVEFYELSD